MRTRQRGLAILTFAMASTITIPLVGAAMDGAMLCVVKQRLSVAAAASARKLPVSRKAAERFLDANFPEGHLGTSHRTVRFEKGRLELSVDAPTYFLQLIHVTSVRVAAAAAVQ